LYKRTRGGVQRAEVRFDGIAGCLRTPRGGSSRQTVVLAQNKKISMRLLAPIEAARLMGLPMDSSGRLPGSSKTYFPDDFSYNEAYLAMGDGVAVPVVEHISQHLLTPIAVEARTARSQIAMRNSGTSKQWREATE